MTPTASRALGFARPVIQFLTGVNLLYAAGIAALLVASFVRADWPWIPLGFDIEGANRFVPSALRTIMVLGLAGAALVHTILRRLLAIVETVRAGDPFVTDNVVRLQSIARRVMGLEVLRLCVHVIAERFIVQGQKVELGDAMSFTPWLAVLLLFVLAGVFAQGSRMRTDLEGTV